MSSLAIIPARGGSKRIPRKNIRKFNGKPIIVYSIEAAIGSNCFDEIMVSTDDNEIAEVARKYGASVPFMRSEKAANDYAGLGDVVIEVLERYGECQINYISVCCILPTAPLIKSDDIVNAKTVFNNGGFDTVFPIVRFSYPILRALKVDSGKVSMLWPEYDSYRSQDLPPAFHDCGLFYWVRSERFLESKALFSENSGFIELPESRVQDIDTEEDWLMAEMKYRIIAGTCSTL
jgi:pseudaminic acid cytidylyltransferase